MQNIVILILKHLSCTPQNNIELFFSVIISMSFHENRFHQFSLIQIYCKETITIYISYLDKQVMDVCATCKNKQLMMAFDLHYHTI